MKTTRKPIKEKIVVNLRWIEDVDGLIIYDWEGMKNDFKEQLDELRGVLMYNLKYKKK